MKTQDIIKPISGQATISLCDVSTKYARDREREIMEALKAGIGFDEFRKLADEFYARFLKRQFVAENVVCDSGKAVLAQHLANDFTYTIPNYCLLGTNAAAGDHANTILGAETYRKLINSRAAIGLATYLSTWFMAAECSGTYYEIGHVIGGTASANTGQLWSRIADPDTAELPITKSTAESLTVDYKSLFS